MLRRKKKPRRKIPKRLLPPIPAKRLFLPILAKRILQRKTQTTTLLPRKKRPRKPKNLRKLQNLRISRKKRENPLLPPLLSQPQHLSQRRKAS